MPEVGGKLHLVVGAAGSGKSTVLHMLEALGARTVDLDKFVHGQYARGERGYAAVRRTFGDEYVNEAAVDRKKLGELVFADPARFGQLKRLVEPIVADYLDGLQGTWFVEMAGYGQRQDYWRPHFASVTLVTASDENRRRRIGAKVAAKHGSLAGTVDDYMAAIDVADVVPDRTLVNDGDIDALWRAVRKMYERTTANQG